LILGLLQGGPTQSESPPGMRPDPAMPFD